MKISSIKYFFLEIPFKNSFAHASAVREKSETFITQIISSTGKIGIGESCPRRYVTGETLETCRQFLMDHQEEIKKIESIDDLKSFVSNHNQLINKYPSAWCSIELALLDILAREDNKSVEEILGISHIHQRQKYTAVVGISSKWFLLKRIFKYRLFGFSDFKLKLSGLIEADTRSINILRRFGISKRHIRLDGNNVWQSARQAIDYLRCINNHFWAIEEPIAANDFVGLSDVARSLNTKIILDESFLNSEGLENIYKNKELFIPNIRISKMGGVLRAIEIIEALESKNCEWILGSHVGETSLLTRASLLILNKFSSARAAEGGFGSHLLTYDPFFPELKLGFGARIASNNFKRTHGWGMDLRTLTK